MLSLICALLVCFSGALCAQEAPAGFVPMPAPTVAQLRMFGNFRNLPEERLEALTQQIAQAPVFMRERLLNPPIEARRMRYARLTCYSRRAV